MARYDREGRPRLTVVYAVFAGIVACTVALQIPLFMRPPYGSHNAAVKATLESIGYISVLWNLVGAMESGDVLRVRVTLYHMCWKCM